MGFEVYKIKDNNYRLINLTTKEEFNFEGDFKELLNKIEKKLGVTIYLPAEDFFIRKAHFPKLEREKIKDILPFEMEDKFIEPSKNLVMDFVVLAEKDNEIDTLVFAIEKEKVERYVKSFDKDISMLKAISIYYDDSLSDHISNESFDNRELNFIPKEYLGVSETYLKFELLKKTLFYLILISLVFSLGEAGKFFLLKNKEKKFKSELLVSSQILSQGQKVEGDVLAYLQSKIVDLKNNYKLVSGMDVLEILKVISQNIHQSIKIKEILGESLRVTLKGECKDSSGLQQFKLNLQKVLKDSKIIETKSLPDGTINFVMELELNEI